MYSPVVAPPTQWCNDLFNSYFPTRLGKVKGKRKRGQEIRCLNSLTNSMDMNLSKLQEIVENREAWCATIHGVAKNQTRLSDSKTAVAARRMPSRACN